jgi:putative PEP-CTERM system histidine kinase
MTPQLFSIISIILNVSLCIGILFRNYKQNLTIPLFAAAILLPLIPVTGEKLISSDASELIIHSFFALLFGGTIVLGDISSRFLRKDVSVIRIGGFELPTTWLLYIVGAAGIMLTWVAPLKFVFIGPEVILLKAGIFENTLLVMLIGLGLFGLYILESTYRFAMVYQRRVGHLCFLALLILWVFTILFTGNVLLYQTLNLNWMYTSLSIYGVTYPLLLIGFFRYRLSFEHVSVDRNAVYSSIVFTLGGILFTGVGIIAYIFNYFNIDVNYFEKSLLIAAFIILITVVLSSGGIRRRIIEFVNKRFYSNKYDYREQFFHLYKTYVSGNSLEESLTGMIENMKYAVAADDAFVFLKSTHNNSYVMHRNPEFSTSERMFIAGSEFPESLFIEDFSPLYLYTKTENKRDKLIQDLNVPVIKKLAPSVIFPICNDGMLRGLLMVKLNEGRVLDQEDIELINVFTHSIGAVFYKNILANEKIEQEQFQSFHQVVSFVIHDIKNQIATLSLLARNATEYITDQDFQKSLIRSIKNSAENLTVLVTKLTEQRNAAKLKIIDTNLITIIDAALEQCNFALLPDMELHWQMKEDAGVKVDLDVMKSIVFNILKNAIEAMSFKGKLTLLAGMVTSFDAAHLECFGLSKSETTNSKAIMIIEDTGPGMTQDFIDNGLFKPFVSTKDKGMGIGLYQCKVSIERMGGKIYCYSRPGVGTAFCVMV